MATHYFDRSRIEVDAKCPRRLYWEYYYNGKGLQPVKLNQHLAFGGAVHNTIEAVLNYCREFDNLPDMEQVVSAIGVNKALLRSEFINAKGFQSSTTLEENFEGELVQVTEDQTWLIDHYCDLLEGLVVGWCLVRLPLLMQQYRVVQVETEERLVIDELGHDPMVFLSRPDAILERRTDGALVILSLKTVSQVNTMWLENFKTDQQTISEVLPVEFRLGKEVAGVQVEGLTKGPQAVDWPRGSGHKHHASPLIWGYLTEAGGLDLEWKAKWEWTDEAGNSRRLGKGWNRQRIAERYPGGIPEWCTWLYQNEPELLRAQFPSPPLISRSANELEEWQEQVKYRELEVANALVQIENGIQKMLNVGSNPDYDVNQVSVLNQELTTAEHRILAQAFPKHTTGCAYDAQFHSKCPCYSLCWQSQGQDPLGCGEFKYRVRNHPEQE
jgi:hypothetical protein